MISAIAGEDTPIAPRGPLAAPGRYTVRLTVDGAVQEQPLVLTPDPRVKSTPGAFAERLAFESNVVAAMNESYEALARVRVLRKKLSGKTAERALALEAGKPPAAGLAGTNRLLATSSRASTAPTTFRPRPRRTPYARARANLDRLLAEWRSLEGEARARGHRRDRPRPRVRRLRNARRSRDRVVLRHLLSKSGGQVFILRFFLIRNLKT